MTEWFEMGGVIMWPILVAAILMAVSTVRASRAVRAQPVVAREAGSAVLFWGGIAAVLGVLGTVVGVAQMARFLERAGSVSTNLVWSGIGVTLVTTVFGLLVLLLSLLSWYGLRVWSRRIDRTVTT